MNVVTSAPIPFTCSSDHIPDCRCVFFTSPWGEGSTTNMPVGVVDLDNTTMTREMVRKLTQNDKSCGSLSELNEVREMPFNITTSTHLSIFHRIPTSDLLASRQPKISFYYSYASITSGALLFRDLKTISSLGSAAIGAAKLSALGKTSDEIKTFLQPITLDLHPINNPEINYNVYLTTTLTPACLLLFIFLITAYSIGTELKFNRSKEWMKTADGNIVVAIVGKKILPQTVIWFTIVYSFLFFTYSTDWDFHAGE